MQRGTGGLRCVTCGGARSYGDSTGAQVRDRSVCRHPARHAIVRPECRGGCSRGNAAGEPRLPGFRVVQDAMSEDERLARAASVCDRRIG